MLRVRTALTTVFLLTLATGCAWRTAEMRIPLGEWKGSGIYVTDEWSKKGPPIDPASEVTQHGKYETQLKIQAVEGTPGTVQLEILSLRGKVARLDGDRTHIIAKLTPRTPGAEGDYLRYRLTAFGISFDDKPPKVESGPNGLAQATYVESDGDDVVQIEYADGYIDTLRFRGDRLYKDGVCTGDEGFIHWSEVLRRQR